MKLRFDLAKPLQVGGQAVIEGVMMRAPGMVATVVRKGENDIRVRKEPYVSLAEKNKVFKLPVLRGAVGLVEMLVIGVKTLNFSDGVSLREGGISRRGYS